MSGRQPSVTPYSNTTRPRRRDEQLDVKSMLIQEIARPDTEQGYNRFGRANPVARAEAGDSYAGGGGGRPSGGGNGGSLG